MKSKFKVVTPLLVFTLAAIFAVVRSQGGANSRSLEYSINEELPRGSFVGNVREDSNITSKHTPEQAHRLRFEFRHANYAPYRYFSIDERKGVISTAQVLDREVICPHSNTCDLSLDVKVKPGEFFQVLKVLVHLADVNDHAPSFPQDRVVISVAETTQPGALFLLPPAEDADGDQLSIQEYRLESDTDAFELKVTDYVDGSKDIRLRLRRRLDREEQDGYGMTVVAVDGGTPQRSGVIAVEVVVLDSNDNNPRFQNASLEVAIYENLPIGTLVAMVHATDPDHGPSGVVTYSFAEPTERDHGSLFRIDDRTGEIYLRGWVDYEVTRVFLLTVVASDMGSGSLPVFAKVTVNVIDLNDNAPVIVVNVLTDSGTAQVRENADPGTFVAHAAVKDADSGEGGRTECSVDGRGLFRLEPLFDDEYKLVTLVSFDREDVADYTVTMSCRDNGSPSLTTTVDIEVGILDENDNSPLMSSDAYVAEIAENNAVNTVVTKINATDKDAGKNCALLYRLAPLDDGTPSGVLVIDPITGRITAKTVFDYERRREYRFLVTVSDRGDTLRSSTATLLLYVVDVNDEKPRFDKSFYYFSTRENQPIGTVVGRVNATDLDKSEEFRRVEYRLLTAGGFFQVNSITGDIFNSGKIDREEQATHCFTVVAFNDDVTPPRVETAINVTVDVEDVNDNNPVFQFPSPELGQVEISSQSGAGALVTRIIATDADRGENSELTYSISNGNLDRAFNIHPKTGVVTLAKELDVTGGSKLYKLIVVVKDNGQPSLMTVADLRLIANASADAASSNSAASLQAAMAGFFQGTNLIIVIGAALGFFLVLIFLAVAIFLCARRRNKRREEMSQKFVEMLTAAGVNGTPCSHQCRSPACSSRAGGRKGGEGSIVTGDTGSVRSAGGVGGGAGGCRHQGCGECREPVLDEDDEVMFDEGVMPWCHRDAQIIMSSRLCAPCDQNPQSTPTPSYRSGGTNGGIPRGGHRGRSRSPRANYNHCVSGGDSGCCCCCGGGGGGQGAPSSRLPCSSPSQTQCHRHQTSRAQSPEYIPMRCSGAAMSAGGSRNCGGGGGGGAQDSGSLCSWPDSGRGPSEEEDALKAQIDPLLQDCGESREPCCAHRCHLPQQQIILTGTI